MCGQGHVSPTHHDAVQCVSFCFPSGKPETWHDTGMGEPRQGVTPHPPLCASTAAVPKAQAKQRLNSHPMLRQARACAHFLGWLGYRTRLHIHAVGKGDVHILSVFCHRALALVRDGSNWGGGGLSPPPRCCDEASRYASKKTGHRLSHAGYQEAGSTPLPEKHSMQTIALSKKQFFFVFCWCTWVLIHCHSAPGYLFTVTVHQGSYSLSQCTRVVIHCHIAPGFLFTVTVGGAGRLTGVCGLEPAAWTRRPEQLQPQLHRQHPQPEQLLRRDGLHGSFFVDMPRQKHTADHTDNPPSFDP